MQYDVITVLDTCVDLIINLGNTVPEFDQKEKWMDSYSLEMGGSSCIFACQCAKLGLKTAGIGMTGDDAFGKVAIDGLRGCGVDVSHLKPCEEKTGLGVLLTRKNDRSILTYSGTIGAAGPGLLTDEILESARHLHVGSYYLLSGMRDAFPEMLRRAKKSGLTVSLDTNWDPEEKWDLPDDLLSCVDIVFPNENEAMLLTGADDLSEAIRRLNKKVPVVAVKLGAAGAVAAKDGEIVSLPAFNVSVADTVGAGDSFDAGFAYAFLNGMNLTECLKAGIFCGSMSTSMPGGTAGQPDLVELLKYLS